VQGSEILFSDLKASIVLKMSKTFHELWRIPPRGEQFRREAVSKLCYKGLFRGHPAKPYYSSVDGVGFLLYSLLQLDRATAHTEALPGSKAIRVRLRMRGVMDESSDREARLTTAEAERWDAMTPTG